MWKTKKYKKGFIREYTGPSGNRIIRYYNEKGFMNLYKLIGAQNTIIEEIIYIN